MCQIDWTALAAWVQAVGAIIALFVAVGLPALKGRAERRQLRRVVQGLIDMAIQRIDWLIARAQLQADLGSDVNTLRLGEVTGLLARVPLDRLTVQDIEVVLQTSALCRRMTDYWNQNIEGCLRQGGPLPTDQLEAGRAALLSLRASLISGRT